MAYFRFLRKLFGLVNGGLARIVSLVTLAMQILLFCGLATFMASAQAAPLHVTVQQKADSSWELLQDGKPIYLRGVGGDQSLKLLKEMGGNCVRTWGAKDLEPKGGQAGVLDQAEALGLRVMAGLWVDHRQHGFVYADPEKIKKQRDRTRETVRKFKDHPALLLWGLGNEMEGGDGEDTDPRIWKEMEELHRIVREEDPHHPICTVISFPSDAKVKALIQDYTSLEILGVNVYGAAPIVPEQLLKAGWKKAFILAEYGPVGHWEGTKTEWGASIEQTSEEKAEFYGKSARMLESNKTKTSLGGFAFLWGQKQEVTSTWYGMFLRSGEKLPSVDAIGRVWLGKEPPNPCPQITFFDFPGAEKPFKPGQKVAIQAKANDPEKGELSYRWNVREETKERSYGGDGEKEPDSIQDCLPDDPKESFTLTVPTTPGNYRLFLQVINSKDGASARNICFSVQP